jgi:arginine utilization protein RocB
MSYLGLPEGTDIEGLKKNFPAWGSGYEIPLETIAQLNIPFLNIGPHGKDAHRTTERLCLSDSFDKTVPLLYSAVEYLLKSGN